MFHTEVIVPVITASGAIVGAILGTYFTGKHGLNLEDKRMREQRIKQNEIDLAVMSVIAAEIIWLRSAYTTMHETEGDPMDIIPVTKAMVKRDLKYPRLPVEMKASAFNPILLLKIENAYHAIDANLQLLILFILNTKVKR